MTSILVDSNVLIDIVQPVQDRMSEWANRQLSDHAASVPFVVNPVIAAELSFQFLTGEELERRLPSSVWRREALPFSIAFAAGEAHRLYRERGGRLERTLPDFLIGAHALVAGYRLLTRDPARYKTYFPQIDLISPETHP